MLRSSLFDQPLQRIDQLQRLARRQAVGIDGVELLPQRIGGFLRLGRQRGRKRILAPDGSELTPPAKPQPDGVLVKALARAWRCQKKLDRGTYSSVTEIAEAEKISKSYVSRILRLALLAPDLVEAILGGWADQRVMLERLERPLPAGWEEQQSLLT